MHAFNALASLALLLSARLAQASVYVTNPVQATVCTGGQSCLVQWVDNGESPLLGDIGECDIAVYTGELELAQSLPSVNVATTNSFTFTPSPAAGPNGQYYIVFTASSINYMGFSGTFTLSGMTGTAPGGSSGAGGSSTPGSTPAGSSTPVGSTPGTASPTGTETSPSSPTGTSPVGTTTPTESTPTPSGTPTGTTPLVSSPTPTAPTTSGTPVLTTASGSTFSTTPSATPTNAAVRVGSSASLGSAFFLALAGALVF